MTEHTLSNFLKKLRKDNNLTLVELGKKINLSKSTISSIEKNKVSITDNVLYKYSNFFNIPKSIFDDLKNNSTNIDFDTFETNITSNEIANKVITIPYFESISAGIEMNLVDNNPIDYVRIPNLKKYSSNNNSLIAIKVNGESMNKVIPNGAIAIIDISPNVNIDNGDIIAYQLDNEYGLKRFFKSIDKILLVPESHDTSFKTKELNMKTMQINDNFQIIGKLVYQFAEL